VDSQAHAAPFVRHQYKPFTRADAVAIAVQEWRRFGQLVDDAPPGERSEAAEDEKPERRSGLWQRIGEYWWLGQDADRVEAMWTGKHDETGNTFPARRDAEYAWSAAFISYVMRTAGAGARFPYSASHSVYINAAQSMSLGRPTGWAIRAEAPDRYAARLGDIICYSRTSTPLRFADLPARAFSAHCDIVVARGPGELSVIGGNVNDAVTLKHVPVSPEGMLAQAGGRVLDPRYPWMVVLMMGYQR
jgi:hypothetical protein